MKILSIGNSFSQDAQAYLHQITDGAIDCMNLYIGGCSLETHAVNLRENLSNYTPELNGRSQESKISIPDALKAEKYDVITLQQASHFSGKAETYFPYISELYDYVREVQPNAKIYIHETWAYEVDSNHPAFPDYGCSQEKMFTLLHKAYTDSAKKLGVPVIPVGSCVQYFRKNVEQFDYSNGTLSLNRDGFHLSIPYGRMLAGYVWAETLLSLDVRKCTFIPDGCSEEIVSIIRDNVHFYMNSLD